MATFLFLGNKGVTLGLLLLPLVINLTLLLTRTSAQGNETSCDFDNGLCGYQIITEEKWNVAWILSYNKRYNFLRYKGGFIAMFNRYQEGERSQLQSPVMKTSENNKVEFHYFLPTSDSGEIQVTFSESNQPNEVPESSKIWQDTEGHGFIWNYGCMDLPSNKEGVLIFTGIVGQYQGFNMAIDDIVVSDGRCEPMGVMKEMCTFDNSQLCNYTISGGDSYKREYRWRRHRGQTSSSGTGPYKDASNNFKGFYLYAESSYGKQGDSAIVNFPVRNTTGKYLNFWYHMYGRSVGSLHLRYNFGQLSKEEWTVSGNQRNEWKQFCQRIEDDIDSFSLVAVHGSSFLGDIAIDNVKVDDQQCPCPFDCDFQTGTCNYIISKSRYFFKWYRKMNKLKYPDYNWYMEIRTKRILTERATSSLISPQIRNAKTSSLTFEYQMHGQHVNKLEIFLQNINGSEVQVWSNNDNTTNDWIMGCVNLPQETIRIVFKSTNGFGAGGVTRLDNVKYQYKNCPSGIFQQGCNFDQPNICGYDVKYNPIRKYSWKRGKFTPTQSTGPTHDHTGFSGKGYFMYAESSFGRIGDETNLIFPSFVAPPGHYLLFYYHMNGLDIGELQVNFEVDSKRTIQWKETGNSRTGWMVGCVNLEEDVNTTVIFSAIRGNGPLGDIAVDDISVAPGFCPNKSLACEFNEPFLCGYQNVTYKNVWRRENSSNYMKADLFSGEASMRSPTVTINDSCVRIYYYFNNDKCVLNVYAGAQKKLCLAAINTEEWMIGQFYIENAEISIKFEAVKISDDDKACEVEIKMVEVTDGNCEPLDCPNGSLSCKDQSQCIHLSWFCDETNDCVDASDESNCPIENPCADCNVPDEHILKKRSAKMFNIQNTISERFFKCNFDDNNTCGYVFNKGWILTKNNWPKRDHSKGSHQGYYMKTRKYHDLPYSIFMLPKYDISNKICLTFFYFAFGNPKLLIYAKGLKRIIQPRKKKAWVKAQVQLEPGSQTLLLVAIIKTSDVLALDSLSASTDLCPKPECPPSKQLCPESNGGIKNSFRQNCILKEYFCDGENDCPGMTDEQNCPKCKPSEFLCRKENICLPKSRQCDNVRDCEDSSDEHLCFVQSKTNMLFLNNNKYFPMCANNMENQEVADKLCRIVGRGKGKIKESGPIREGILFTKKESTHLGTLFDFTPMITESCSLLNLTCAGEECGIRSENRVEPTIQSGIFSFPGQWPWQALLKSNGSFVCGATLISRKYLVTAAHCVKKSSSYTVVLGSVNMNKGKTYKVKNIIIHPDENFKLFYKDIAVLELNQPVGINDDIRPVCLPSKPWVSGTECYITGWGKDENGLYFNILRKSKVFLLNQVTCKKFYKFNHQSMLCANNKNTKQPGCNGDSGGPLVCRNKYGYWEFVGVTSLGLLNCAGDKSTPTGFTDVYNSKNWIKTIIN